MACPNLIGLHAWVLRLEDRQQRTLLAFLNSLKGFWRVQLDARLQATLAELKRLQATLTTNPSAGDKCWPLYATLL